MVVRMVTAAQAIEILPMLNLPPVTNAAIWKWAERGKVKKYGLDQFGCRKYDLQDIILAANEAHKRQHQVAS